MKNKILKFSWIPAVFLLFSCWKEPVYPKEPSIEFSSISQEITKDTSENPVVRVHIALNFKDGDGDLGLNDDEILAPPYKDPNDPKKANNYFLKAYMKINGEYVPYPELTLEAGNRFLRLEPTNNAQTLEGELRFFFDIYTRYIPFKFPDYRSGDSVKFDVYITDRAFNRSNTVRTEPVPVFEL